MTVFDYIPALIRLLFVFIIVIVCVRKKISLGNSFFLGAIGLGLVFGLNPSGMVRSILSSFIAPKTFALAVIVSLILVLSNSMEMTGQMKKLLENFKGLVKNSRLNIIVFPALIGLLPMPGGAVFSAPMVKELGAGTAYTPARLSYINYWFRHVWEYWWPLYPGILLIAVIAEKSILSIMMVQGPLTLFVLFAGYFYLEKQNGSPAEDSAHKISTGAMPFLKELLPVLMVIFLGIGTGIFLSYAFPKFNLGIETGLIFALILAIMNVWFTHQMTASEMRKILINPQMLKMIYMIFAILVFKGMLEDSHAVGAVTRELVFLNIPLLLIVAILPFLVGLITGITIAFVGSAFPILIPLVASLDPAGNLLSYLMLAMVCGFAGVLMSPVHLCLILSNEYFGVSMGSVYRYLWKPCLYLVIMGFVYFYILKLY
ncbi:MAG: DUF401 family protein [Desulfobacterales bacterium]